MSKIIILGDIHFGIKQASPIMLDHQLNHFKNVLFPYLRKHNVKKIIQLGDLWDTRKFTNHYVLNKCKEEFFDHLKNEKISFITILGNHDIFYKNNLEVNSSELFLSNYKNVKIIKEPTEITIDGINLLLVPWICKDNESEIIGAVSDSKSLYCLGHFEFSGFSMQKGIESHGDQCTKLYEKFDKVMSGHYHTRSEKSNVLYTGTPYELTWADFDDQKGFHVLDSKTHKLSFVKNKNTLFKKITYDDEHGKVEVPNGLKDCYVKIIVLSKNDVVSFNKFLDNISLQNPLDIKIIELEVGYDDVDVQSVAELEDTKTLLDSFIENIDTPLNQKSLKKRIDSLYLTALDKIE